MKPYYITTTLPYVNAEAHVGHAVEFIRADVIARVKKIQGYQVFFNTGTDEHGTKIARNAESLGVDTQLYVDEKAEKFKELLPLLGISDDIHFTRTTDPRHKEAAQAFWNICMKNGFLYKKNYKIKYCVGCELEKTDSELVDGKCSIHPALSIEEIEEENYFFAFSEFEKQLLSLYEKNPRFVIPDFRFNEIRSFVERGLQDFSVSRLKSKMPWGVPVPGDENHVMYVWFDALVNYISALGWPHDAESFKKWWIDTGGVVQYCGKDNLRQQSAMWQAMLMAAELPPSRQIVINGFVTGEGGIKMSKSLGNVINPLDIIKEYGTDALRYYVLREIQPFEDSPFTLEKFKEAYNAHLANGLGNLVSRTLKMMIDNGVVCDWKSLDETISQQKVSASGSYHEYFESFERYEINRACDQVWSLIQSLDKKIQDEQPFKVVKVDAEKGKAIIKSLAEDLYRVADMLIPLLPQTAEGIKELLMSSRMPDQPLFLRK